MTPQALMGMEMGAATVETGGRSLKKLKTELPYDPAIRILSIYLKIAISKIYLPLMFTAALFELCLVSQSLPTLCSSMDCSPPGFLVLGILQVRTVEWVAISSSRQHDLQ